MYQPLRECSQCGGRVRNGAAWQRCTRCGEVFAVAPAIRPFMTVPMGESFISAHDEQENVWIKAPAGSLPEQYDSYRADDPTRLAHHAPLAPVVLLKHITMLGTLWSPN